MKFELYSILNETSNNFGWLCIVLFSEIKKASCAGFTRFKKDSGQDFSNDIGLF